MITRKARLFLVKYKGQDGMVSSYVYTNTEEKARDIVKESGSKHRDKYFFYEEIFPKC